MKDLLEIIKNLWEYVEFWLINLIQIKIIKDTYSIKNNIIEILSRVDIKELLIFLSIVLIATLIKKKLK